MLQTVARTLSTRPGGHVAPIPRFQHAYPQTSHKNHKSHYPLMLLEETANAVVMIDAPIFTEINSFVNVGGRAVDSVNWISITNIVFTTISQCYLTITHIVDEVTVCIAHP